MQARQHEPPADSLSNPEPSRPGAMRIVHKTCNLCEAMCGLVIEVEFNRVRRIIADPDDPLSRGAICPKAIGLEQIQNDPDRLKQPLLRTADGWETISWDAAIREAGARLAGLQGQHGNDAVATYLGNPGAHNFGTLIYLSALGPALDTRNRYLASSLDQNPKHASSLLLYGNFLRIPVPDIDRTQFLLVIGANPIVSGGSLMTAPGFRKRIRRLKQRGGQLVVIDPKRTATAEIADRHIAIGPGRDAWLLAAMVHTLLDEGLGRASALDTFVDSRSELQRALAPFSPEAVAARLGIEAPVVRQLVRDFAAAPSAACYGRVGICMGPFATLSNWLVDVLNLLSGNLDREGGCMFPQPAVDLAELAEQRGATGQMDTGRTRVRAAPSFNGERPTACLAEEILTPGDGQIRGMLTIAGNPCLSAPNGAALREAFASLEYYVAIDFYLNETTRYADLILPPTWSLEHDNHEALFHLFAVQNTAKYSPTVIQPTRTQRDEWQILGELALEIARGKATSAWRRLLYRLARPLLPHPRRLLDWMLRLGPRGDGFRPWRSGLRLRDLEAQPSGVDLGPLQPNLADMLNERGRRLDLAPEVILAELRQLANELGIEATRGAETDNHLLLIGRRDVRTCNSWFHNIPLAVKGRPRCTLEMHPDDAKARGLVDGNPVSIRSRVGSAVVPLALTDALMPGVCSLPHGWGHTTTPDAPAMKLDLASAHAGVNCNDLTDDAVLENVVGNAVLNGVPVTVDPHDCPG